MPGPEEHRDGFFDRHGRCKDMVSLRHAVRNKTLWIFRDRRRDEDSVARTKGSRDAFETKTGYKQRESEKRQHGCSYGYKQDMLSLFKKSGRHDCSSCISFAMRTPPKKDPDKRYVLYTLVSFFFLSKSEETSSISAYRYRYRYGYATVEQLFP